MHHQTNLKIIKFGGTSVGSATMIRQMFDLISHDLTNKKVVVVSAPSGVTDMLLSLASGAKVADQLRHRITSITKQLRIDSSTLDSLFAELKTSLNCRLPQDQKQDLIASFGERFSIEIISQYFNQRGLAATPVDSRSFVVTDSNFTAARYDFNKTKSRATRLLNEIFRNKKIPIVTGFLGKDAKDRTTTLGRGGSDLTATLIGKCLNANLVEIWTDADGIMTADPRRINSAALIKNISFDEVFELSNFGAKIIYSKALEPAYQAKIPIKVLNTFNPQSPGTLISDRTNSKCFSVTVKQGVSTVTVTSPDMIGMSGYLAKLFRVFKDLKISVDIVAVSEASVSITAEKLTGNIARKLRKALSKFGTIDMKQNCGIVALVSRALAKNKPLLHGVIKQLTTNNINIQMISYDNRGLNLSLVINGNQETKALALVHDYAIKEFRIYDKHL